MGQQPKKQLEYMSVVFANTNLVYHWSVFLLEITKFACFMFHVHVDRGQLYH